MNFNKHSEIKVNGLGDHAFLSGSKYHWVNYDSIDAAYMKYMAVQRGIELHDIARRLITMGIKLPKSKKAFNQYVNDAIGYRMTPEQLLYYSPNAFGTADTISFRDNFLRIHDLKTGVTRASVVQLEIYSALFCLEYDYDPKDIIMELRIYKEEDMVVHTPSPDGIHFIMDKIIEFDIRIEKIKEEARNETS